MDKLKIFLNVNKRVMVFLIGILIIGVIFGSCLPIFLSTSDKSLVTQYLSDFVCSINNDFNFISFFKNSIINNSLSLIIIWIVGISIVGAPIALFMFFFKCFIMGFSISSIIINYGFKGILFSFAYVFPHNVIDLCIYCLITSYSLIFSIKFFFYIIKKYDFNIRNSFNKYLKIFFFCFIILILSVLYESFLAPYILQFILKLLGI